MKILIVDDEMMIREWLDMGCADYGIAETDRFFADNGKTALEMVSKIRFDLIFTDITMPLMSGLEFIKEVKKITSTVKIVILTCHADFDYAREAVRHGVDDYLLKGELSKQDVISLLKKYDDAKGIVANSRNNIIRIPSEIRKYFINTGEYCIDKEFLENRGILLEDTELVVISFVAEPFLISSFDLYGCMVLKNIHVLTLGIGFVVFISNLTQSDIPDNIIRKRISDYASTIGIDEKQFVVGRRFYGVSNVPVKITEITVSQNALFFDIDVNEVKCYESGSKYHLLEAKEEFLSLFSLKSKELLNGGLKKVISDIYRYHIFDIFFVKRILCEIWDEMSQFFHMYGPSDKECLNNINYAITLTKCENELQQMISRIECMTNDSDAVRMAMEYVSLNYFLPIGLSDIASIACLSEEYFSRLFKKTTGKNFIDYLNETRMKKANQLLKRNKHSINEICQMVGIQSPSYFSTLFKKYYNITPSEVRGKKDDV